MKKILALLALVTFMFACSNNDTETSEGFQINCKVSEADTGKAFLLKYGEDKQYIGIDTAEIKGGKFVFNGKLEYPQLLLIEIDGLKSKVKFFAENSTIDIQINKDSLDNPTVSGSSVQEDYDRFMQIIAPYEKQLEELYPLFKEASKNDDNEELKKLDNEYDRIDSTKQELIKEFIKENPTSIISPYAVRKYLVYYITLEELNDYLKGFDSSLVKSDYYQYLSKRAQTLENVVVGKPAPDFTVKDTSGNPVSLSDYKGKYVLVDFWASWCGPCRRENPNVVAMYNKYNDHGFEVFSVSFDSKRENWLKAIEEDNLTWTHVSELKGWNNEAGKLYGIISIPHTVLIDKEGIIIAKGEDTRGEKLQQKLTEIFGK